MKTLTVKEVKQLAKRTKDYICTPIKGKGVLVHKVDKEIEPIFWHMFFVSDDQKASDKDMYVEFLLVMDDMMDKNTLIDWDRTFDATYVTMTIGKHKITKAIHNSGKTTAQVLQEVLSIFCRMINIAPEGLFWIDEVADKVRKKFPSAEHLDVSVIFENTQLKRVMKNTGLTLEDLADFMQVAKIVGDNTGTVAANTVYVCRPQAPQDITLCFNSNKLSLNPIATNMVYPSPLSVNPLGAVQRSLGEAFGHTTGRC